MGLTVPVTTFSFDGDYVEDFSQTGVGFEIDWLGISIDSGLTFRADFSLDFLSTSEIDDADTAFELGLEIGAGYSFVRNEKFTVGVLGMLGFTYGGYEWTDKYGYDVVSVDADYTINFLTFDFGADLVGKYQFTENFGAYASLGFRYGVAIDSEFYAEAKYQGTRILDLDEDTGLSSGFKFKPTIGLCWTF